MRILLANYRYFVSGGPERYMFNVSEALTAREHEIVPFSIRYTRNLPSPYASFFVEPLGSPDELYFHEQSFTLAALRRTLQRLFYAPDVEREVRRLVSETQPQVAYVLCYLRKLSPSLLVGLKKTRVPIVVRLSDYAMLCPRAICWRANNPCELCVHGNLLPSVYYRCVQDSLAASAFNALATWYHRLRGYFDFVDVFVTTTQTMYQMMIAAGFPASRLRCIPTFVDADLFHPRDDGHPPESRYIAYVGRLDDDKGVHVLMEAWQTIRQDYPTVRLRLAGSGNPEYVERIKSMGAEGVEFLGPLERAGVAEFLRDAYLTVVPSLGYDNLPNTLLESYASGVPVLASDLGSFRESVENGETGYRFEAGNPTHLAERIGFCLDHVEQVSFMAQHARTLAVTKYSLQGHLCDLEALFSEMVAKCTPTDGTAYA